MRHTYAFCTYLISSRHPFVLNQNIGTRDFPRGATRLYRDCELFFPRLPALRLSDASLRGHDTDKILAPIVENKKQKSS